MPEWHHIFHSKCMDEWFENKGVGELNCPHWNIKLLTNKEIEEKKLKEEKEHNDKEMVTLKDEG